MNRIVGLLDLGSRVESAPLVERMAKASLPLVTTQIAQATCRHATFGITGDTGQPVRSGDLLLVLDGRLFNREDLGDYTTDADAILSSYRERGFDETLRRLNGDFAIALYDARLNALWLGRDRFGVKPLYFAVSHELFGFGSRPRALLAMPGISGEVNHRYVARFAGSHYRAFDNEWDASPYANIRQVPPAHAVRVTGGGEIAQHAYWSLSDAPDYRESEAELAERYRELLLDAVARRVKVSDRRGFTLSGGMDSSSVLASAVKVTGNKQPAFSTVYEDKTYDESDEIVSILDATVSQWHRVPVDNPDVFGLIRRMVEVHDEPVATATWLAHFVLCEQAAELGFRSLFGGLGGDELNAGEYEHFLYHFADLRVTGNEAMLAREVEMWAHYHDHPIYRKNRDVVEQGFARLVDLDRPGYCRPDRARLDRYVGTLDRDFCDLRGYEPEMDHPFSSFLKNRTYQDLSRETIPPCLRAEDRQAAAFGLENFLPFLDHRLVEFMYRVPGIFKYREGVTKHLLREAMIGVLPEETRTRVKKTGWNAPAHVWFSGAGREPLLDLVHSRRFQQRGIYNIPEVLRLVDEHEDVVSSGRAEEHHMMFLWQLVNLELWQQAIEQWDLD